MTRPAKTKRISPFFQKIGFLDKGLKVFVEKERNHGRSGKQYVLGLSVLRGGAFLPRAEQILRLARLARLEAPGKQTKKGRHERGPADSNVTSRPETLEPSAKRLGTRGDHELETDDTADADTRGRRADT